MSAKRKRFTDEVSFAGQPSSTDLESWADAGVRTVVNLRPTSEIERALSPPEEKKACLELEMSYFHLPTSLEGLDESYTRSAKAALNGAETPMVIHCAGGARAAILAAALHSMSEGTPGENVVAMIEASGQSFNKDLRKKVVSLADSVSENS